MIISKDPEKNEWKVTNKKLAYNQTWVDGVVTKDKGFHCTCEQFRKHGESIGGCTHIKQVKEALKNTEI